MTAETATAEVVEEVIDAVTENPAKVLGFIAGLAGAALATYWVVKRVGIAATLAADDAGLFEPPAEYAQPAPHEVFAADESDVVDPEYNPEVWGDHRPAGAEFMGG